MKTYNSPVWGNVAAPETFLELMELITKRKHSGINVSYWRGQACISWKLHSSIVRKIYIKPLIKNEKERALDETIRYWEEILLNEAKKNLYSYDEKGRKLSDIELLAKLQHYGAATRLLDFSKNALIALWFCVSDNNYRDETGVLIGVDTNIIVGAENEFDFDTEYSLFFKDVCSSDDIWMVDAPAIVPRISSQSSVFLCSRCVDERHGSFLLPDKDIYKTIIALSPELKKECLKVLSECFNITPLTIYPDIEGFADAHSSKWKIGQFTRW